MIKQVDQIKSKVQSLAANQGFRKYFINTGWLFGEKVLRLISGIFIGAYVARYLEPSQFGLLNYVMTLVGFFNFIVALGMDHILIRELVKDERKRDVLMGTAFVMRIVAAIMSFAILVIMVQFTSQDLTTKILIYIIGFGIIGQAFGVLELYYKAKIQSGVVVLCQTIALTFTAILRIILVLKGASLPMFALAITLDYFIAAGCLIICYQKKMPGLGAWTFDWVLAKRLFKSSWPLIFSSFAITAYMQSNQIIIKWVLGNEASGYYGVCTRLSEMWYFIPLAISSSVFPALVNSKKSSEKVYSDRLQHLLDLMVIMSVSIALPLSIFSDFFVILLFGDAYAQSADIMSLYVWSGVFVSIGIVIGNWVVIEELQRFRMIFLIIAGILNVVLSLLLTNLIGLNGAAISTLISYAFAAYFHLLFIPKGRFAFIAVTRAFNPLRLIKRVNSLITKNTGPLV